jgi:hypothetical protein
MATFKELITDAEVLLALQPEFKTIRENKA